ncbi:hypothetical protein KFE25_001228 [Diacronema lutheri]|uniref:thioredoxin-dependent peroxiredoxin n=1 Tax=Diacronema lutheri TaxID=2081491 RepID=A0A7R9YHA3_DIALT|nr:hypothetical protein KFE25_001228 [Diacronema lutheri]
MAFIALALAAVGFSAPALRHAPPRSALSMLAVGEKAPVFELPDANGKTVKVTFGGKSTVLFFFPSVDTPGCTKEAMAFSAQLKQFSKAKVIGISGGNTGKYAEWIAANNLGGLTLLADKGDKVRGLFKVPKAAFGLLPGRVTYVIDKNGVCQEAYDNLLDAESHVTCALNAI